MIKDRRFMPFDEREPVEDDVDDFSDELLLYKRFMRRNSMKKLFVAG